MPYIKKVIDEKVNIRDYLLDIDDINQPKVIDLNIQQGKISSGLLMVIRLIIMRKGTNPDIPNMGVDISGRYKFAFDRELAMFQTDVEEQIATYLPEMLPVNVKCYLDNRGENRLTIELGMDGVIYMLAYNPSSSSLEFLSK